MSLSLWHSTFMTCPPFLRDIPKLIRWEHPSHCGKSLLIFVASRGWRSEDRDTLSASSHLVPRRRRGRRARSRNWRSDNSDLLCTQTGRTPGQTPLSETQILISIYYQIMIVQGNIDCHLMNFFSKNTTVLNRRIRFVLIQSMTL